jgi:phage anti-repressor protein
MDLPFLNDSFHIKIKTTKRINMPENMIKTTSRNNYTVKIEKEKLTSIKLE